jgi:hypothetical protein
MYPGHMGTYIGHRSGYQLGGWWFSRGLNQRVVEPAKGEGQGVAHGSLRRAIQEWLQYEVAGFLSSCNTSAIQAADMDIVDVLHPGVGKGVLVGGSA